MRRWWQRSGMGREAPAYGEENVSLENVKTTDSPTHATHNAATRKTRKPMTGVMEALFFATGGEYAEGDDGWDPFEGDVEEEDDIPIGDSLKMMESDGLAGDTSGMGQALAVIPGPQKPTPPPPPPAISEEPDKPPFNMEKLNADIREIENIIGELRSKENVLDHQLRMASQESNNNQEEQEEALLLRSTLKDQLKRVREQILAEATRLDKLMENGRKEMKAQDEANKKRVMPKPKPAKDAGPDDVRTCRRGFIPRPEPSDKSRPVSDSAPKAQVTADIVRRLGAGTRELPEKKEELQAKAIELSDLNDQINEYDQALATKSTQPGNAGGKNQGSAAQTFSKDGATKATPHTIRGLRKYQSKLTQRCEKLAREIEAMEIDLPQIKKLIENDAKVNRARRNYQKNKDKFTHSVFQSIRYGRLDDLAVMTAALDMEDENITDLIDDDSKYSPIHVALVTDQQDIVEFLLKHSGRDMAMNTVETEECDNLTPFYIAVQHGKAKNVELLLDVLTPEDRKKYINTKVHNKAYEKTYYNELPLAAGLWSAAGSSDLTEISTMLDCLVQNGARLDLKTDDGGNTLLHLLVAQSCQSAEHIDYFRTFLKQPFTKAAGVWYNERSPQKKKLPVKTSQVRGIKMLMYLKNKMGFTPLTLAAQLESPLYIDLIRWKDVMRFPDPKLGQQFSNLDVYDVTNVTSLKYFPKKGLVYNLKSVMHVLAHNNLDITQALWDEDISTMEPLKSIISQKWQLYRFIFYLWGFIHLLFMCVFSSVVFRFGPKNLPVLETDVKMVPTTNSSNVSYVTPGRLESGYYGPVEEGNPWFILFASLPLIYILFEIIDHCTVGIHNVKYHYSLTGNAVYRVISLVFSLFTLIWIILHMVQNVNQDIVLSIALLFGWLFGILFTRTINFPNRSSQIGAFSIMVQRMLFHDLLPFLIISCFILIAFSSAIHATLLHTKESATERIKFRSTFFDMLKYYSALDDGQDHTSSREKEFAKAVLSVYGIISVVLLINMLIAAMNKTYDLVRATHTDLVVRQRLAILLMLERRLPFQWLRKRSEAKFEIQKQERFLQVVCIKDLASMARKRERFNGKDK